MMLNSLYYGSVNFSLNFSDPSQFQFFRLCVQLLFEKLKLKGEIEIERDEN